MSPFTSFVAVDDSVVVNPDGDPVSVDQLSQMSEFVSFEGCFGSGGPDRTAALPIPVPAPVPTRSPASTGEIHLPAASAPPGQAVIEGAVRDTEGSGIPGAVVKLSRAGLGA